MIRQHMPVQFFCKNTQLTACLPLHTGSRNQSLPHPERLCWIPHTLHPPPVPCTTRNTEGWFPVSKRCTTAAKRKHYFLPTPRPLCSGTGGPFLWQCWEVRWLLWGWCRFLHLCPTIKNNCSIFCLCSLSPFWKEFWPNCLDTMKELCFLHSCHLL